MSKQYIILKGRVTGKPEKNKSKAGKEWLKIGLAVNYKDKNEKGKEVEKVTFYNLMAFGRMCKIFKKLKKGEFIRVEGDYLQESYVSKEGEARINNSVFINELTSIKYI